jgi:hypothetical protein
LLLLFMWPHFSNRHGAYSGRWNFFFIYIIKINNLLSWRAISLIYRCTFGPGQMGRPEAREKKARPRHGTARNNLVPGRHGPLYRAGFGPRSRPMGGHGHGPFKAGTKWPI